jgi:hypothetical protein
VLQRIAPSIELQQQDVTMQEEDDRPGSADSAAHMAEDAYSSSPGETMGTQPPINLSEARNITRNMEDETEAEPGPYVRPGVPAIPPWPPSFLNGDPSRVWSSATWTQKTSNLWMNSPSVRKRGEACFAYGAEVKASTAAGWTKKLFMT